MQANETNCVRTATVKFKVEVGWQQGSVLSAFLCCFIIYENIENIQVKIWWRVKYSYYSVIY